MSDPVPAENRALLNQALAAVVRDGRAPERQVTALAVLSRTASRPEHDPAVEVLTRVRAQLSGAYERGWQPLDLVHVARWRGDAEAGGWLGRVVLDEFEASDVAHLAPQRWIAQISEIRRHAGGADDHPLLPPTTGAWTAALATLAVLEQLPGVQLIAPAPSHWGSGVPIDLPVRIAGPRSEDKMLARVRSLLAKAESTEFGAEAEAFTAKAQDLMTRYAIDEALVRAQHGSIVGVDALRVMIEPPYAAEKALLLHLVAEANHTRAIWSKWASFVTLIGVERDVDHVEMLFTSVLLQAVREMTHAGESNPDARSIGFRKAFLNGYALRLGERLTEATRSAEDSYGGGVLPVLAAQQQAVNDAVDRLFPKLRSSGGKKSLDAHGWRAGTRAADAAVLPTGELDGSGQAG